jgi:hypothetical protein
MSYPHRIRLRGPWQVEPLSRLDSSAALPAPVTMRMPGRLGDTALHEFRGRIRFRRTFGYPGRIDVSERIWLTFRGVDGQATVALNNQQLGDLAGPGEFDVTRLLQKRNALLVDVECSSPTSGLWDDVALEVRATAFLQEVHFSLAGTQLEAKGIVVGSAERPLDLYLLVQNHCEAYQLIQPTESGLRFTLAAQIPEGAQNVVVAVRVELVNGAMVWYVVEGSVQGQSAGGADSS